MMHRPAMSSILDAPRLLRAQGFAAANKRSTNETMLNWDFAVLDQNGRRNLAAQPICHRPL